MTEIVMPRLSDTMEEGTVLRWLKRDGEHVRRGEELVEIETDKAAMVYESDQEGLLGIVAQEGDTLPVGATIANVHDAEGAAGTGMADAPQPAGRAQSGTTPDRAMQAPAEDQGAAVRSPSASLPEPPTAATPAARSGEPQATVAPTSMPSGAEEGERVKASPLARRIARESGLDLNAVTGTGPGGRIVKADVEAASRSAGVTATRQGAGAGAASVPDAGTLATRDQAAGAATPEHSAPATLAERVATAKGETTIVELTRTQQTIARRMAESKATIPDFALQMEIDMEQCVALRAELKRLSPEAAPTYNDMVVKACALALREHPRANGSYRDGRLQLHSRVNVGVAVAVNSDDPTGGALVVPTVFDTDLKSLGEIARETRALAERVRAGTITPPELGGGTFTVSNLGMYGVSSFAAIINPPQAAILSVGLLGLRPAVCDGELLTRHTMFVTLVCDHRILYGADAAGFLARVRELLEEPASLTL